MWLRLQNSDLQYLTCRSMLGLQSGVLFRSNTVVASCSGRDAHKTPLVGAEHALESISHRHAPSQFVLAALKESRAAKQLGTLGGGNHFLEVASTPCSPVIARHAYHW